MSPPGARRRWLRPALVAVAVVAVAAAAAFANVALLGSAGEDRIGRLRPVDPSLSANRQVTTTAPAVVTVAPVTTDDGDDSGRGHSDDSGHSDDD